MSNANTWYYRRGDEKCGPVASSELVRMARSGELKSTDLTWNESLPEWVPAARIKGLFPAPQPPAPQPPQPVSLPPSEVAADSPLLPASAVARNETNAPPVALASVPAPSIPVAPAGSAPPPLPPQVGPAPAASPAKRSMFGGLRNTLLNKAQDLGQEAQGLGQSLEKSLTNRSVTPAVATVSTADAATRLPPVLAPVPPGGLASSPSPDSVAAGLRAYLGEELWQQLVAAGLRWESVRYWTRLRQTKIKEATTGQKTRNVSDLVKLVSNKVSSAVEQVNVVESRRVLVVAEAASWYVAGQFGVARNVWPFRPEDFRSVVRMHDSKLEIELEGIQPDRDVQGVTVCLDFGADALPVGGGLLDPLLGSWLESRVQGRAVKRLPLPLFLRASQPGRGSFLHPLNTGSAVWVTVDDTGFRLFNERIDRAYDFAQIVSWRDVDQGLECLAWSEDGICRLFLSPHGQIPAPVEAAESGAVSFEATQSAPVDERSGTHNDVAAGSLTDGRQQSTGNADAPVASHPGTASLRAMRDALRQHAASARVNDAAVVAELNVSPLFDEPAVSVAVTIIGTRCRAWIGMGNLGERAPDEGFAAYDFPAGRLLWAGGKSFRVELATECSKLWQMLCKATEDRGNIGEPHGVLAILEREDDPRSSVVTARLDESGQLHLSQGNGEPLILSTQRLAADSLSWTPLFGTVQIGRADQSPAMKLTAAPRSLLGLWEGKEMHALKVRIAGVKLGELYDEFACRRTDKFLAGVFGSLLVTHQQLESGGKITEFRKELDAAPPGPLSDELSARLVQRLSILEISRQQLSRWFDRCSLYLPHYWALQERELLEDAFGDSAMDPKRREREAWRVQQAIRGELRQVQASLGRPLQELGQNLNAVSFAFPEEVRCAALASVRNAAGLAEKGAMLTAFGGIGAQMLMGLGRASMGDPIGIAMLGTIGLSLVGKHLQKKAKDAEQQIRLRAYGSQALQWWEVVQESAFVMALECRQSLEQLNRANFERDKKLLESLPREQLPIVQKRMVATMRQWLQANVQSQFYEVLPGSGLFGHQLVRRIAASADSQAGMLIRQFGYELPGSSNKE